MRLRVDDDAEFAVPEDGLVVAEDLVGELGLERLRGGNLGGGTDELEDDSLVGVADEGVGLLRVRGGRERGGLGGERGLAERVRRGGAPPIIASSLRRFASFASASIVVMRGKKMMRPRGRGSLSAAREGVGGWRFESRVSSFPSFKVSKVGTLKDDRDVRVKVRD